MSRTRILYLFAFAFGIAVIGACSNTDGGPSGQTPSPGTLTVVLDASDNNARAIHFTLSGSGISSVGAGSGLTLYQRTSDNSVSVAALGSLAVGATIVTFNVPNVNGAYTVSVVDVADDTNALLNKNNYTLSVQ